MRKCFVISPIGPEDSEIRKWANKVFNYIIKPAMDKQHIIPQRSDQINETGRISDQMFKAIYSADLCIADLSEDNPNVFFELGVALSANRPVIILVKKNKQLPFDVSDLRCVSYDFDPDALHDGIYVNKIIDFIKEFEETGWTVPDLFSAYRPPVKNKEVEIVDYDDIDIQLEKTVFYKMLNLKSVDNTQEVIYEKYIPRLNNKIGVSSEFMTIRANRFDKPVNHFKSRDRTSGDAIEVNALLPFHLELEDGDKNATLIEPLIFGPSNVYVVTAHTYNGFKVGDLDLGFKVEKDTKMARLIIDFSSVPNFDKIISSTPKLFYRCFKPDDDMENMGNLEDKEHGYKTLAPGIFFAEITNMKMEEALRFDFTIYKEIV